MLNKGMIHIPSKTQWDTERFHHMAQNKVQFKACCLLLELSIFIFFLFSLGLTKSLERKTIEKGEERPITVMVSFK